jgi:glutathione S-transferase
MLRILGKPTSINVRKVLWLCEELRLDYDLETWGKGFRSTRDPAFLALNPNATVPVIVDADVVLWESNTICRYLAARAARTDLLPASPRERARVEQWMDWQATELNNAWRVAFLALVRKQSPAPDALQLSASVMHWNQHMQLLDAQLARGDGYVVGADFSLADIVLGLSAHRWRMTPMQRPALPFVSAWLERLQQRESFLRHASQTLP